MDVSSIPPDKESECHFSILIHFMLLSRSIPPENIWFSNVFRGYRKRIEEWNGLIDMINQLRQRI